MFSRSMTINVTSRIPAAEFRFADPTASQGSVPDATPLEIGNQQTMTVTSANPAGGCVGGFSLAGEYGNFGVSYDHPLGPGPTVLSIDVTEGYLAGANAPSFPGHDSVALLNLYQGVPANNSWVVPLGLLGSPPVNNCQDFVNSLFASAIRDTSVIIASYVNPSPNGYVLPADFTGGQMAEFVAQWAQLWRTGQCDACPPQDADLIQLLANYMRSASNSGPLVLWIPQIDYDPDSDPSVFALHGYLELPFMADGVWNPDAVEAFLSLLAAGAHFVSISANADLPQGVTMSSFDEVLKSSTLKVRHDIGNSHYSSVTNMTGTYYLDIGTDFAPENCGLILAFLAGRTVNNPFASAGHYNTFIQLEGWQAGSVRHIADYATYKKTLWNISTYGACPYSEKRATSVFLAPPGWRPQIYQITRMMPYVGAYAHSDGKPQPWLDTDMVIIPADAPPLPSRYYD